MEPRQIPTSIDERIQQWRDRVAGKRLLLVLDDALSQAQVEPMLPGMPGCLVLITSRRRLMAFDGAEALPLDTLPTAEAESLFTHLAGRLPSTSPEARAVTTLTELCGKLPLAITLLAGRVAHHPTWTYRQFAADLAAANDRLTELTTDVRAVAAAFDLSYTDLPARRQRLFRRLALHPGDEIDAYATAALDHIPLTSARQNLDALYTDHLIDEPHPGRFRFHDLVRLYAQRLAESNDRSDERTRSVGRLLDYFQYTAAAANRILAVHRLPGASFASAPAVLMPEINDRAAALSWMQIEHSNLLACLDYAGSRSIDRRVVDFTAAMAAYLQLGAPWRQAESLHRAAVGAARRIGDHIGEANSLSDLGRVPFMTGDYKRAVQLLKVALVLRRLEC
jgi:hypothetical protein